jgi:sporulation protein YlmC with PRC-barrel domain
MRATNKIKSAAWGSKIIVRNDSSTIVRKSKLLMDHLGIIHKPGQTSLGLLGMHRGSRVQASDGPVGQVDQILVDPTDERVTHFMLRQGRLLNVRQVMIPTSQIIFIKDNVVHLKLDCRSILHLSDASSRGSI